MNAPTIPTTSSSSYPDNMNGFGNRMQSMPGMQPQSQWPTMLPPNSFPAAQQQQQPQLQNYPPWQQMQNQTLPTGMTGMAPVMQQNPGLPFNNNLAPTFLPTQLLQDVLRLSTPVGSSANDDELLAKALHDTKTNGFTYRLAIEGLHGINNHSANLWKDYYLEHKPRIDRLVSSLGDAPSDPVRPSVKPPFKAGKLVETKQRISPATSLHTKRRNSVPKTKAPQKASPARRKTFNSITAPEPVYDSSMPAPNAEVQVPEPPSRSPTPPRRIVPGTNGNRYTDEDKGYFIKFISWRLKSDPDLTKAELCEKLAQKAPQHSQMSWASHWHARHDLADKILAAAQVESASDGSDVDAEGSVDDNEAVIVKKPYKKRRREDDDDISESSSDTESSSSSYQGSDDNDMDVSTDEDEERMSKGGDQLNRADIRMIARYVANTKKWEEMSNRDKWLPFNDRFPQRSYKNWADAYRRNKKAIHRFARRFQKQRQKKPSTLQTQRARPTWANKDSGQKRKASFDKERRGDFRHKKRARDDDSDDSSSSESDE